MDSSPSTYKKPGFRPGTATGKGWLRWWRPQALSAVLATPAASVAEPAGVSTHHLRILADVRNLPYNTRTEKFAAGRGPQKEGQRSGQRESPSTFETQVKPALPSHSPKPVRRTRRTIGTSPLLIRPLKETSASAEPTSPSLNWSEREEAYLMEIAFLRERLHQLEILYRERGERIRRMERSFPIRCRAIAFEAAVTTQRMLQQQRLQHRAELRRLREALLTANAVQMKQEPSNLSELQNAETSQVVTPGNRKQRIHKSPSG